MQRFCGLSDAVAQPFRAAPCDPARRCSRSALRSAATAVIPLSLEIAGYVAASRNALYPF